MSIHTLTLDDLLALDPAHHQLAAVLYTCEINSLIEELAAIEDKKATTYLNGSDRLGKLYTLRKIHLGCLPEVTSQMPLGSVGAGSAMNQYALNERQPALV